MPSGSYEAQAAAENYRDDAPLAARQSIWAYAEAARSPLEHLEGSAVGRVLDVGCGNGLWLKELHSASSASLRTGHVTGLDLSMGMLQAAARRVGSQPLVQADAARLPIAEATIDTGLAMWMLYHVPELHLAIQELRRVIRPGGRLLAVTVGSQHLAEMRSLMTDALSSVIGKVTQDEWSLPFRFTAETAAEELGRSFLDVRTSLVSRALRVPEAEPVLSYLTSLRGFAELALGGELPWPRVLDVARERIDHSISARGHFSSRAETAILVCR